MGDALLPQLAIGQRINKWVVEKKLGEGAFGGVYRVADKEHKCAMKIESAKEEEHCLKMDVAVLGELSKKGGRHFCRIEDRGRNDVFYFIVMTLVGQSLADLRRVCPGCMFTLPTALAIGIQCLEAVEDLHTVGFLHRDLKPANYAIGREEQKEQRKIFVLDFGMCRKYITQEGRIRTPRRVCGFRGTVRYAPLGCHKGREMSRKDDAENWLYQQIEITVGRLPWHTTMDADEVMKHKERCRTEKGVQELFAGCPREYVEIMRQTDKLRYLDQPNYGMMYDQLRKALKRNAYTGNEPFDWEVGGSSYARTSKLPPPVFDPNRDAGPTIEFPSKH